MRIAIVTETYLPEVNGVALTVAGLVHGLAGAGHQVQLVRPRQIENTPENVAAAESNITKATSDNSEIDEVLVRGAGLPRYPGLRFGLPAARKLKSLWRAQRPDAIYVATEGPLGYSALRAASALGIPVSTGFHTRFDDFARHYGLGFLTPLVFGYLRRFHQRGHATLVPTIELVQFLTSNGFRNVQLLRRAVDTQLFSPRRRDETLRAQWGLNPQDLAVLYVGRIAPEKNLAVCVAAFREIQQQQPNARYIWIGDGPARTQLAAANPDFIFTGIQRGETLARFYASCDLFLFPSITETFGNVTLEAMASGLPTVAFDYGAAREHLLDHCGRRVPFADTAAFIATSVQLAATHDIRRDMCNAARAAVAELNPHAVTASFSRLLANLATRRAA
jgi:glycosyltransferase involved in cell wall biosynthesis